MFAAALEALAPEVVSFAMNALRSAIVDAAEGFLPSTTAHGAREWFRIGVDGVIRELTGQAASAWANQDRSAMVAAITARVTAAPDAAQAAVLTAMASPAFILSLTADAGRVLDAIRPLSQRLFDDVTAPIPQDEPLTRWATRMGQKYNMTQAEIVAMRSAFLSGRK